MIKVKMTAKKKTQKRQKIHLNVEFHNLTVLIKSANADFLDESHHEHDDDLLEESAEFLKQPTTPADSAHDKDKG